MNDKDFHAFRKSIEQRREIEFDEKQWDKLARWLDEGDKGRRRPLAGWWAAGAALLLALLLGNVYLFGSLREMKGVNEKIMHRLEQLSGARADTAWREKVIYIHDTIIYERVIYREAAVISQSTMAGNEMEGQTAGQHPGRLPEPLPYAAPADSIVGMITKSIQAEPENSGIGRHGAPDMLKSKKAEGVKPLHRPRPDWGNYLTEAKPAERSSPFLLKAKRAMQPKGFAAGTAAGVLLPLPGALRESAGWQAGIGGELIFSEHLRMRLEANYESIELSAEAMGASLGIPIIPSPYDDFDFSEAKAMKNAFHFNFGMKYLINARSRLQPFVYTGLGTAYILPSTIVYDFENADQSEEVQLAEQTDGNFMAGGFGLAGLGMSYTFAGRWSLQLEGLYRAQLSKAALSNPGLAAFRTILLYRLKGQKNLPGPRNSF